MFGPWRKTFFLKNTMKPQHQVSNYDIWWGKFDLFSSTRNWLGRRLLIVLPCSLTLKIVCLSVLLIYETICQHGTTVGQPLASQNPPRIRSKLEKPIYPTISQPFFNPAVPNATIFLQISFLTMGQQFAQLDNFNTFQHG